MASADSPEDDDMDKFSNKTDDIHHFKELEAMNTVLLDDHVHFWFNKTPSPLQAKHLRIVKLHLLSPFLFNMDYKEKMLQEWVLSVGFMLNSGFAVPAENNISLVELIENIFSILIDILKIPENLKSLLVWRRDTENLSLDEILLNSSNNSIIILVKSQLPNKWDFSNKETSVAIFLAAYYYTEAVITSISNRNEEIDNFINECEKAEKVVFIKEKVPSKDEKEKFSEILKAFDQLICLKPFFNHSLYCNRALVYKELEQFTEVWLDCRRCLALKSSCFLGFYLFIISLSNLDRTKEALENCTKAFNDCENSWTDEELAKLIHLYQVLKKKTNVHPTCLSSARGYQHLHLSEFLHIPVIPDDFKSLIMAKEEEELESLKIATEALNSLRGNKLSNSRLTFLHENTISGKNESLRNDENDRLKLEDNTCESGQTLTMCIKETMPEDTSETSKKHSSIMYELKKLMRKGSEALLVKRHRSASQAFTSCLKLISKHKIKLDNLDLVILKYACGKAFTKIGLKIELQKALKMFKDIILNYNNIHFPLAHFGVGEVLCKQYKFAEATEMFNKALKLVDKIPQRNYLWPETIFIIDESNADNLKICLEDFLKLCHTPPLPDTICGSEQCSSYLKTHIYYNHPDFNGLVTITCNQDCDVDFHPECWSNWKMSMHKTEDKSFKNYKCFTKYCSGSICKIRHSKPDLTLRKEIVFEFSKKKEQITQKKILGRSSSFPSLSTEVKHLLEERSSPEEIKHTTEKLKDITNDIKQMKKISIKVKDFLQEIKDSPSETKYLLQKIKDLPKIENLSEIKVIFKELVQEIKDPSSEVRELLQEIKYTSDEVKELSEIKGELKQVENVPDVIKNSSFVIDNDLSVKVNDLSTKINKLSDSIAQLGDSSEKIQDLSRSTQDCDSLILLKDGCRHEFKDKVEIANPLIQRRGRPSFSNLDDFLFHVFHKSQYSQLPLLPTPYLFSSMGSYSSIAALQHYPEKPVYQPVNKSYISPHSFKDQKTRKQDIIDAIVLYFQEILSSKGPLNIHDPILQEEEKNLPFEAKILIDNQGGLTRFLAQHRIILVGDYLCFPKDIAWAINLQSQNLPKNLNKYSQNSSENLSNHSQNSFENSSNEPHNSSENLINQSLSSLIDGSNQLSTEGESRVSVDSLETFDYISSHQAFTSENKILELELEKINKILGDANIMELALQSVSFKILCSCGIRLQWPILQKEFTNCFLSCHNDADYSKNMMDIMSYLHTLPSFDPKTKSIFLCVLLFCVTHIAYSKKPNGNHSNDFTGSSSGSIEMKSSQCNLLELPEISSNQVTQSYLQLQKENKRLQSKLNNISTNQKNMKSQYDQVGSNLPGYMDETLISNKIAMLSTSYETYKKKYSENKKEKKRLSCALAQTEEKLSLAIERAHNAEFELLTLKKEIALSTFDNHLKICQRNINFYGSIIRKYSHCIEAQQILESWRLLENQVKTDINESNVSFNNLFEKIKLGLPLPSLPFLPMPPTSLAIPSMPNIETLLKKVSNMPSDTSSSDTIQPLLSSSGLTTMIQDKTTSGTFDSTLSKNSLHNFIEGKATTDSGCNTISSSSFSQTTIKSVTTPPGFSGTKNKTSLTNAENINSKMIKAPPGFKSVINLGNPTSLPDTNNIRQQLQKVSALMLTNKTADIMLMSSKSSQTNFGKLITMLVDLFPSYSREQLIEYIVKVRQSYNNSLRGLSKESIVSMVKDLILKEEKPKSAWKMEKTKIETDVHADDSRSNQVKSPLEDFCVICYDELSSSPTTGLKCHHSFHTECIRQWLHKDSTCPMCRNHALLPDEYPPL